MMSASLKYTCVHELTMLLFSYTIYHSTTVHTVEEEKVIVRLIFMRHRLKKTHHAVVFTMQITCTSAVIAGFLWIKHYAGRQAVKRVEKIGKYELKVPKTRKKLEFCPKKIGKKMRIFF